MIPTTTTYPSLLSDFQHRLGVPQDTFLSSPELLAQLNRLLSQRNIPATFNQGLHQQLWEQCTKSADDKVMVAQYLRVVVDARDILQDKIAETKRKLEEKETERRRLREEMARNRGDVQQANRINQKLERLDEEIGQLEEDFKDFDTDLKCLLQPFGKQDQHLKRQSLTAAGGPSSINPLIQNGYQPARKSQLNSSSTRNHSQIFFRRSSKTLFLLLLLTILFFLLQLVLMTQRFHFLSLLCALSLIAIFGLNYFDRIYIRFVMLLLFVAVVADLLWLIFKAHILWSPKDFSQLRPTVWHRVSLFLIAGEMVLKVLVMLILLSYRNSREVESINICGYTIALSGGLNGECCDAAHQERVRMGMIGVMVMVFCYSFYQMCQYSYLLLGFKKMYLWGGIMVIVINLAPDIMMLLDQSMDEQMLQKQFRKMTLEKLQEKGQYLTHILLPQYYQKQSFQPVSNLPLQTLKKLKINPQSIQSCLIQFAYVCYVCHCSKISITEIDLRIGRKQLDMNEPVSLFITCEDVNGDRLCNIVAMIQSMYRKVLEAVERSAGGSQVQQVLGGFKSQYTLILRSKTQQPNQFLSLLEQTELFRKYSMLLKTQNCSILNYIQCNQKRKLFFTTKTVMDGKLQRLVAMRADKSEHGERLRDLQREVEMTTKGFLDGLGLNIQWLEAPQEDPYKMKCVLRLPEKEYGFEKRMERVLNQPVQMGKVELKFPEQEFFIEYSCERCTVCVKYLSSIPLNVENSDLLMYQFNNLSFDSSTVSLQLHQKTDSSRKKNKYLAFKSTSCLIKKQSLIEKILILMDIAMITAKIIEPQVLKPSYATKDFHKPLELHQKVNHYIGVLNYVASKVYKPNKEEQK